MRDHWRSESRPTVYVTQISLTGGDEIDPVMIDHARTACMVNIERHVELHGLAVTEVSWHSDRLTDEPEGVTITAAATCVERTDGEWAAIRQAIAEDEADRLKAELAATYTHDSLDALRESMGIWTSSNPHEALRGSTTASSVTLTRLTADGRPVPGTASVTFPGHARFRIDDW